jgi:hypothetical protein
LISSKDITSDIGIIVFSSRKYVKNVRNPVKEPWRSGSGKYSWSSYDVSIQIDAPIPAVKHMKN